MLGLREIVDVRFDERETEPLAVLDGDEKLAAWHTAVEVLVEAVHLPFDELDRRPPWRRTEGGKASRGRECEVVVVGGARA